MSKNVRKFEERNKNREGAKSSSHIWIYGKHPVEAALQNPRRKVVRILATQNAFNDTPTLKSTGAKNLDISIVRQEEIEKVLPRDAVHQGIAIEVETLPILSMNDIDFKGNSVVVLLDQVTDPHNVGAILRSALAFGVAAVIAPRHHTAEESGALAKAASGALEKIPFVEVTNLAAAMEDLKKKGFWIMGLDGEAEKTLQDIKGYEKLGIVLGAEGKGLRRLTLEKCDLLAKISISSEMESLNVSNAAAVALYEITRK